MIYRQNEFDERMKRRAQDEDCPVPAGFDARLAERLAALPEPEERPARRRRLHGRTLVLAAAVAAVATAACAAVSLTLRQSDVHFFDSVEDMRQAALEKHPATEAFGVSHYGGADYLDLTPCSVDWWWDDANLSGFGDNAMLLEDAAEGSVRRRVVRYEEDGRTVEETGYRSAKQSGLAAYVPGQTWDTAFLEERYTATEDADLYIARDAKTQAMQRFSTGGEYTGAGDVIFNLTYSYDSGIEWEDMYEYVEDSRSYELYQTADGVTVAVQMGASHTGKAMYWASLYSGHVDFQFFGTELTLDELHELLDSLHLSSICEYE